MPQAAASRRRFKSPYWDVAPAGFESVGTEKYKAMQAAGQIPHTVVNPSAQHLQSAKRHADPLAAAKAAAAAINAVLAAGGGGLQAQLGGQQGNLALLAAAAKGGSKSLPASVTRQARRLYVGNIPFGTSEDELVEFFETNLREFNFVTQAGCPVLACQINLDKNFAFVEFRTVEETASALALDGIMCKTQPLKVRRPHDYQPIPGSEPAPAALGSHGGHGLVEPVAYIPGVVSTVVMDSANKIYIGGIPTYLTDDQIKEILATFGTLKAFNLIKEPATLASKGYAFCEYLDSSITEQAIAGLNGFDIGDKKLTVQRASLGGCKTGGPEARPPGCLLAAAGAPLMGPAQAGLLLPPVQIQVPGLAGVAPAGTPRVLTEILCLLNMVEPKELQDDEEYAEIVEDIREECAKYGRVLSMEVPRPSRRNPHEPVAGLGKVFVEFDSATEAQRAQSNLAGRRFANRVVVTSYFDRDRYRNKEF